MHTTMLLPRPTLARLTKHHPISSSRSHPRVAIQPHHQTRLAAVAFDPDAYELEDDEELDEDDFEDFTGALDEERQGQLHNAGEATTSSQQLFRSLSNPLRELPRVTSEAVTATSSAAANVAGELLQEASQHVTATAQQLAQRARTAQPGKTLKRISSKVESKIGELPEGFWAKVMWLWELPPIQRIRVGVGVANLGIKLPALLVLIATQCNLLAAQVTLPMLAPLLLGSTMALRSVQANASFVFPRLGIVVVLLWILWFANNVVRNTVRYLLAKRALDDRLARMVTTSAECVGLVTAGVVVLSLLGVRVSSLLLPAGVALAVASKDLLHNFLAGLFLFAVQPFRLGDTVAVPTNSMAAGASWFEGTCEAVDLRYTMIRSGRRKLMIPNSAFLTREFVIVEEEEVARTHSVHGTNNGTQQHNGTTNGDQHTVENPLSNGVTMNGMKTNGVPHEVMATRDASMESM